ncbi:MAG: helix-hairpin-helix domain-containing protein [Limnohabitans sp.]|nr:helix-hairpin-helix domain-containing protein [Limnohabitans sp.]
MIFNELLKFNRDQRIGLFVLVLLIVTVQCLYYFVDFSSTSPQSKEEKEWLALQTKIDSVKAIPESNGYKMYPFNPNFITDYKGYKLGMTTDEIDRLLAFRKTGQFVNSAEDFQKITKVSSSLLTKIAPYFKFPDWVKNKNINFQKEQKSNFKSFEKKEKKIVVLDINLATKEDLMKIYGVGDVISDRILKQREAFGGFVSMEQMQDVWGLSSEVVEELNKSFKVFKQPEIAKIDVNNASTKELMKLPYFRYAIAREIITYRSMNGGIKGVEDLSKIKGIPVEKVKIIALYLDFQKI